MKRISRISRSNALRITGAAIAVGIVAAYTPALGNGSTWSLPYTGSASSSSPLISLTNTGSGDGLDVTSADVGIRATSTSSSGTAVFASGSAYSVAAWTSGSGYSALFGGSTNTTTGSYGVWGYGGNAGVYGYNPNSGLVGVQGSAAGNGEGVYGTSYIGVEGVTNVAGGIGVQGSSSYSTGFGVSGFGSHGASGIFGETDTGYAVSGISNSSIGVYGYGDVGVYGGGNGSGQNLAGEFGGNVLITGNLQVNGTINKSAVGFKIDHPLDPAHKFLMHSCVESNEMMNLYRGNAMLDTDGKATIVMPDWFQAENTEVSYQLTAIGKPAPGLYISKKIENNQFEVAGGEPGVEVSWQLIGARNDKYAVTHPLKIEVDKPATEQGKYIRPEEYGQPETKMIGYITVHHHTARKHRELPQPTIPNCPKVPEPAAMAAASNIQPQATR